MEVLRGKFLAIMASRAYTQFEPEELRELYDGCKRYMKSEDPGLTQADYLSLMEMLFYVGVYLCDDVECQVLYNTFRDRFGEDSPRLYAMKATLLQINEGDAAAIAFIQSLTEQSLEIDTDSMSYVLLQKKLLSMQRRDHDKEWLIRQLLLLIEKFPIDPELWTVAGQTYFELGQFDRAAYCFEEVICVTPFNYPAFGKLAEILYYKALRVDKSAAKAKVTLQQALNNALRSVELSESYLKGWSLVAVASQKLEGKKKLLQLAKSRLEQIAHTSNPRNKVTAELILKSI